MDNSFPETLNDLLIQERDACVSKQQWHNEQERMARRAVREALDIGYYEQASLDLEAAKCHKNAAIGYDSLWKVLNQSIASQ